MIDLGWHHKEYQLRSSFAYTVMSSDEKKCLGCAYLYPADESDYDGEAYCWIRSDSKELDSKLYNSFKKFLNEWPLGKIAFPGRDPNWIEWNKKA